ncbi:MAG TPA: AI-2E family transporter [Steroidobacteraceae bacterium]|jgi:predicted PurR-regulated permease PerM|nr:AI-2E family transporter [Steroidobacteraceae bacterium]
MKDDATAADVTRGKESRHLTLQARALLALAVCAVTALLYVCHEVFVPVALALLFALVLSSAVEAMHRRGLPRSLSAVLMLLVLLTIIGATFSAVAGPAQDWFAGLPQTLQTIERKVRPVQKALSRIELLTSRADALASASPAAPRGAPPPAASNATGTISAADVLIETRSGIVSTITVIILTLFLLSGGPPMLARMMAALATDVYAMHALKVIEAIRSELGRYYGTVALINLTLGIATGVTMMLLGVPNPFLWGTVAAVLNFIPYVGSALTLLILTIVALVCFDSVGRIAAVMASYLALATIEGQIVQPLFVGHRLELNPLMVFLAVWFGGWMWGIAGITVAVPSLVALKVAAEHSTRGQPLVEFLSPIRAKSKTRGRRGIEPAVRPDPRDHNS